MKDEGIPFSELSPQERAKWQAALEDPGAQSWVIIIDDDGNVVEVPILKGNEE